MVVRRPGQRGDLIVREPAALADHGVLTELVPGLRVPADTQDDQFSFTFGDQTLVEQEPAEQVEPLEELGVVGEHTEDVERPAVDGERAGQRGKQLVVVDGGPRKDPDRVYFGGWVEIEDEAGEVQRYQLVGPDEFDAADGRISVDSPVGRALMGKRVGDEVIVRRPKGETIYEIARGQQKDVPTLCYDERLEPFGGCRLCVVEVEGQRNPVASCTTKAEVRMPKAIATSRAWIMAGTNVTLVIPSSSSTRSSFALKFAFTAYRTRSTLSSRSRLCAAARTVSPS